MKKSFLFFFSSLLLLSACQATEKQQAKPEKPNVLFFLVDDMGWMDAGYQGSEFYETPNIDQLATEGMRFTDAYATHPRCVPSRYSLITGRYPAREQMPGPGEGKLQSSKGDIPLRPGDAGKLKPGEFTIANAMKEAGYSTFFIGKWHLATSGTFPEDVGFDVNIAGGHAGSPISYFFPYNESERTTKKAPIEGLEEGEPGEYLTDRITRETTNYLRNHFQNDTTDQPFFAFVSHYAVHQPIEAKAEHVKKFEAKLKTMKYDGPAFIPEGTGTTKMHQDDPVYAAMVYSMDESLGQIKQTLKELGQLDNTIIIFFSDNGGLSNRGYNPRNVATSNYPLRAGKGHLYEGGVREPLIVKWPGVTRAGSVSDAIVTGTDFFPTILDMVDMPLVPSAHVDGKSFTWALKGNENPESERAVFWHSPVPRPHATGDVSCTAVRKGKYKLIDFYEADRVELYNLDNDPGEIRDISLSRPKVTRSLLKLVRNWRKETGAWVKEK
ncbi:sulfatase [Marinilabilia rubra]|uniref:Sulfatase n=1 Tax=Marinilabilia rubra TaxID=2162893 RepID=A0A2U2B5V1_9BACT|nr:sulfatase [Marinilabilia rubra]PWD98435.1 sulfatase [Marinilabilia rubra]